MSAAGGNNYLAERFFKNDVEGFELARASNTTATLAAGSTRDSSNVQNIISLASVTINFSVVGANGIDTGTIGASKLYYVFAIADSLGANTTAGLGSLSATPTLPVGYDIYRRVGWLRTGGSSTLLSFNQFGAGRLREYFYDTMIQVITTGTASSLTAADLSVAAPPLDNMPVYLHTQFTPATANDSVKFAPFGSTATVIPGISGVVAAKVQQGQLKVVSKLDTGVPKVLYINSAGSCNTDAWLYGFVDAL